MSVFSRLRSVRTTLASGVFLRALIWGVAAGLTLMVGSVVVDLLVPIDARVRALLLLVAILASLSTAVAVGWRDRTVVSLRRVALWIEERFPSLEYVLVTAVESGDESLVPQSVIGAWTGVARKRVIRALRIPVIVALAAIAVLLILPKGAVARIRAPRAGDSLERSSLRRARDNRLSPLVAEVVPPAYSGEKPSATDDPTDVRALVGSEITFRGRGDATGIVARIGPDSLTASASGDRWSIPMRVGPKPVAVRLEDGAYRRIVAIEAVADLPPVVTLVSPAHDSVLRTAHGRIPLNADVSDDFGIASLAFEYIVSSGEGESFAFKSGTLGAARPGTRTASAAASLSLDSLGLKPGDMVHLRAVAKDANTVTGPGLGTSETRVIRIARADEYDSVAVDAAAPSEADKSVISERMLIMLAEALQKKRPSLARDMLLRESRGIAADQKKLRRTVGDIVFTRLGGQPSGEERSDEETPQKAKTMEEMLARADSATNRSSDPIDFEGDESPVVAVNKPLLEAYNAMWDASLHLEMGEPDRALPFMRRALDAIQKARRGERLYLRGAPPRVVIDVNAARLKGKDKGSSSVRRPLTASDSAVRARKDRFARIVELARSNSAAAVDSLLLMRIEALGDAPSFASALGDAAAALRRGNGRAAMDALEAARRALAGSPATQDTLSRWGIVP